MMNMLYYCAAVDLIMQTAARKKIALFLQQNLNQHSEQSNVMQLIFTQQYNPEPLYKESLYAVISSDGRYLIILYEDRYCKSEIFLQFKINKLNLYELEFINFGNNEINELYDRTNNYFLRQLLKKSKANVKQPQTKEEYIDLFKKIMEYHWIKKYQVYKISDINNIIFKYANLYEIIS